jgi:D-alanyl-D-alanine carboxypeptidase (penicillin-binding protein 5/6)
MTALVAYELIAGNTTTIIDEQALSQSGDSGLLDGETFTAEKIRELALISSSNDAAYALGASVGKLLGNKDPNAQFVAGMNVRAEELGLNTLSFKNTTGLDISSSQAGGIGSAKDVSFLMEYILDNYPEMLEPTQQATARIYNQDGSYHDIENTNDIIYSIPNLIGSKTGYTDLAGGNLTIAFNAGLNRPIIITVLGSTQNGRFTDVLTLVDEVKKSLVETN